VAEALMVAARHHAAENLADDAAVLVLRVPSDAGVDPVGRVEAATGVPLDKLSLPDYPYDSAPCADAAAVAAGSAP
jgi:hypothetical protein